MIYGITGQKGHGKDTLANFVHAEDPNFFTEHFAGDLKDLATKVFGTPGEFFIDRELKERPLPLSIDMDFFLPRMKEFTGIEELQPRGLVAKTPRELLQFFGTDYVRTANDNYWIDRVMIRATGFYALIPDTRFPNEAGAVHAHGGKIIRVICPDHPDSGDSHASETEMRDIIPDVVISAAWGDKALLRYAARLLAKGFFEDAPDGLIIHR